jgi:CBS domain-containing protein
MTPRSADPGAASSRPTEGAGSRPPTRRPRAAPAEGADEAAELRKTARFLARHELFKSYSPAELERIAATIDERVVPAGEAVLVEGGPPGTELFMVRDGSFELLYGEVVVDIMGTCQVFGHPSLLTGLSPEFTVRAHEDSLLYCFPKGVGEELLTRHEGVTFVARQGRDRLIQAARTMSALPDLRTRPVTSLVRSEPLFCEPDTTVREAARLMAVEGRSAVLIRTRGGLGIVTDRDLRDRVVAEGVSPDAPVTAVMTTPTKTVGADVTAPEASIEMMAAGVNHLPVLDARGRVVGILSASSLMALDARSPFALRRTILGARSVDDVVRESADLPKLFVDLFDAHLDSSQLTRVLTLVYDAMVSRLVDLSAERRGDAPVPFAWLAFGSAGRGELTLASDQDNGLAYADSDDPSVDEYFHVLALDVNRALRRCGFALDPHGTVASNFQWRLPLSLWRYVLERSLQGVDLDRLARASVSFDFRQVKGDLDVVPALSEIIRDAPRHPQFLRALARVVTEAPSPLGFRQRLTGVVDIKKDGLLPIQGLARYVALARRITVASTLERLAAIRDATGETEAERSVREAFLSMAHLQLRHHAEAIRAGRAPDNEIVVSTLRPITRVTLHEALREVAAARRTFTRLAAVS